MSVAALIALGLFAALLLVLALAVLMPVRLELSLRKEAGWHYRAWLRPFGRHGPRIDLRSHKKAPPETPEKRKKKPGKSWVRPQRLLPAGLRLISDILHRIRLCSVQLDARFSLGDPAETGQAFGLMAPLIYGCSAWPDVRFDVEPLFDDRPSLTGEAELDLSVVPASLVLPAIRFGWSAFGTGR